MKKKTYKLKDISYMGLSLSYIALMLVTLIVSIVLVAIYSLDGKWLVMAGTIVVSTTINFMLYSIGSKYGEYGLVIFVSKMLQPRHIKNDFPVFEKYIISVPDEKGNQPE